MSSSRDQILRRLRRRARPTPDWPTWRSQRDFPDLPARFTAALEASQGEVRRATDWDDALTVLGGLLEEIGAERAVVNADPALDAVRWAARFPFADWHTAAEPDGLRDACAAADVGISTATVALAETGAVAVPSGAGQSRLVTLLPPVHVALVATDQLTADLYTWTAGRGEPWPAHLSLISGPSKSADIGMHLITGVHGPGRFVVILFDR